MTPIRALQCYLMHFCSRINELLKRNILLLMGQLHGTSGSLTADAFARFNVFKAAEGDDIFPAASLHRTRGNTCRGSSKVSPELF